MTKVRLLLPLVFSTICLCIGSGVAQTKDAKTDQAKSNAKGKHKFTISKETTHILGPIDKDGYIDYATALNERLSKGVTPDNNANVLIWKAIGPAPERVPMPQEFFKKMGLEALPETGEYYRSFGKVFQTQLKDASAANRDRMYRNQNQAFDRLWTGNEFPEVAEWLNANEKPLKLVLEATQRTHYYWPLVRVKSEDAASEFLFANMSGPQFCRELVYSLVCRAHLHAGEGRIDKALSDLDTCRQIARLVGQGSTLIEGILGAAFESWAMTAELPLLDTGRVPPKDIESRLLKLRSSPPTPVIVDQLDLGERFAMLNRCLTLERLGIRHLSYVIYGVKDETINATLDAETKRLVEDIHWDEALRDVNKLFDRMVGALRLKDGAARDKLFVQIEDQIKKYKETTESVGAFFRAFMGAENSSGRGKVLAGMIIAEHAVSARSLRRSIDRMEQNHRNLLLAFALELHHREIGHYPKNLAALAPKYLPEIPDDIFSGKALIYRPSDKGYLLYSVGPNGIDDQGRGIYDGPPEGDDLAVRMPLPKVKQK